MHIKIGSFEFRSGSDVKGSGSETITTGQIRDSWNDPVLKQLNTYVVNRSNFRLFDVLREAVPFIDIAIIKLVRLLGDFEYETYGDVALKRKLESFRTGVKCNYFGVGLDDFIYQMSDAALHYGYGVGESVVNRTVTDLERLIVGDSRTFRFKKENNKLNLVQQIDGGFKEVKLKDNIYYLAFDLRNGHPQGVSMIYSLVYSSQVFLRIEKAIENLYWRMGDPTAVALVSGGDKTNAEHIKTAVNNLKDQVATAMQARRDGKVQDIFGGAPHGGKVEIKSLFSDFQWPDMAPTARIMVEQIIAKTDLPPFMLGLSWSTTERMSKDQNDMIVASTKYRRQQLDPGLYEIHDKFLILTGDAGKRYKLRWKPVNLLDIMETARARYFEAFAQEKEIANYLMLIDNGWVDEDEITERVREDMRYRKSIKKISGGNGKGDAKAYLQFMKKKYSRRIALQNLIVNS